MKRPAKLLRKLLVLLALGLSVFMFLRWFESSQVYQPFRTLVAHPGELNMPFEEVWLRTQDGVRLHGWYFPGQNGRVALFCHGNAGNISHRLGTAQVLLGTGLGVFLFDYRGYGQSEGGPTEEGTYLDAQAAYEWLSAKGIGGERIIAFGESLGGAVACELALRKACGALVLQSTFTSIPDLGGELFPMLPVRWLSTIRYDTRSKLPRLSIPVLVMHSRVDGLVHFGHAERNFAAIKTPKLFWELEGDHNFPPGQKFGAGVRQFLEWLEPIGSPRGASSAGAMP